VKMGGMSLGLEALGWNDDYRSKFVPYEAQGYAAGRVVLEHTHMYRVITESGERLAEVSGKMRFQAQGREDFPAVGDWVVISEHTGEQKATIHAILPRKSKFSRKTAGSTTEEQIVAANVDYVFLVNALNQDFNLRRMERYLILAWESGAAPVIILSKADLCDSIESKLAEVESAAIGVPVHVISSARREGMDQLQVYFQKGNTVALLGSSGTGKSTLINELFGRAMQKVNDIREGDDRGRHTTTHRELFVLPQGGLIIDTPGMRELQLWHADEGVHDVFGDIEAVANNCYYSDCRHVNEPRCAVKAALQEGTLDRGRYENYHKMLRELARLEQKEHQKVRLMEKDRGKNHNKFQKQKQKSIF
jgi:ribosome biogenesis GTPase